MGVALKGGFDFVNRKDGGACFARFRFYDGLSTIPFAIWNDTNTHPCKVTTGHIREDYVIVLYHVECFVDVDTPLEIPRDLLLASLSNILAVFG